VTTHTIPDNVVDYPTTLTFSTTGAPDSTGLFLYVYISPDNFANRVAQATTASDIAVVTPPDTLTLLSYETQVSHHTPDLPRKRLIYSDSY
jgi:hypothetical protein